MAPTAAGAWLLAQRREQRACRRVLTLPTLVRRLDALPLALLPRRGRAWTGCRTSAAPRWATCAPCRAPACSGAARRTAGGAGRRLWPGARAATLDRAAGALRPPHRADGIPGAHRRGAGRSPPAGRTAGRLAGREPAGGAQDHAQPGARARPPRARPPSWNWRCRNRPGSRRRSSACCAKLGRMTLTDPVIAVALLAPETVAQPAASATLFPEPGGTAEDQRGCWTCSARGWAANACAAPGPGRSQARPPMPGATRCKRPPAPSRCRRCWTVPSGCWIRRSRCAWPATARSIGARRCG